MKNAQFPRNITELKFLVALVFLASIGSLFTGTLSANAGPITGTYTLTPAYVDTGFTVRVLGGRPVKGAFRKISGKMILDQRRPEKSRVNVKVDLRSVETNNGRVTGFLKSSAMFDVANHPVAEFRSTRIRITGQYTADVDGVLTLRGQRKRTKLSVKFTDTTTRGRVAFEVSGGFFRSLYGMEAGLPIYADKVNLIISGTGRRG
ncbi:MAG: YceI family protein [Roseibium sp.]|uniref:YceI family protein n=1 Tax=Roseibium sp. TaxID=1936156 RepID=UPI002631A82B|nr:YceI family protein [Roseibium sp.]MCV0429271.1 YceI family protein [Roseibium sp.]